MIIHFSDDQDIVKIPQTAIALLKRGLQAVADLHDLSAGTEVSVTLVDDEVIHVLNKDYRGIDRPTDVLSFALDEGENMPEPDGAGEHLLGDIIISAETAVRQGQEYGHGLKRELVYLAVHSLLHLLGYDHMNKKDKAEMRAEEEKALAALHLSQAELDREATAADPRHFADSLVKVTQKAQLSSAKRPIKTNDTEGSAVSEAIFQKLLRAALKVRRNAYVPFSKFQVGAAVLTCTGKIFTGCNVENSSFGLTMCAERVAVGNAVAAGFKPGQLEILLCAADTPEGTSPCGACRQVMAEFRIDTVILANTRGEKKIVSSEELLPFGFRSEDFAGNGAEQEVL